MAVQKHNTYYDNELYYYDEHGVRKPLQVGKVYSAGSGIKIENDIISVSGKYVSSADHSLDGKQLVLKDNKWEELVLPPSSDWLPTIKEASANAVTTVEGKFGLDEYNQITSYNNTQFANDKYHAGYGLDLDSSTNTFSAKKGFFALSADVDVKIETLKQEIAKLGFYVCNNKEIKGYGEPDESVLDNEGKLSTSKVYLVKIDTAPTPDQYKEWIWDDSVWTCIGDTTMNLSGYATEEWVKNNFLSANALDLIARTSGNWDSVYTTVNNTSGYWNNVSSKLNTNDFNAWSAQTTAWDVDEYTGIDPIKVEGHEISLTAKYLSANALNEISGASANWNSVYETVNTTSGDWNAVYSKANKTDLDDLSGKVETLSSELKETSSYLNEKIETLSGELERTSSFLSGAIDVVSAEFEKVVYTSATEHWDVTPYSAGQNINITDHTISGKDWTDTIEEASANAVNTVENKFNGENNTITAYGTSSFANDKYTAGEGLALNDHQFYVSGKYITSAGDILAGKMLILKDNEWIEMPEFGGFATANSGEGHPDVQNPSTKLIYLVKNSSVTGNDKYSEWIYTSADAQTTAWECIGDTSLDLTPYLTKDEASATYQKKLTAGNNIDITNDIISVSGLHNTTLTSTNGSIGITATTAVNGDVEYDLGVRTITSISGINGVSAYYDEAEDQYVVGLDDYNDIGFAKYSSDTIYYTSNDNTLKSLHEDLNLNQEKIALVDDKIILQPGLYHVDMQVLLYIGNSENVYYETTITTTPAAAAITQIIDASYEHNETIDLSFDIKIANATELNSTITDFQTGSTYQLTNLNIHEIVSMPSQVEGGASNYVAGRGISIDNDTIEAKIGNGLEFQGNNIQVKLGDGLKFDNSQGVQAVTIDNDVEAVVNTVQKMEEDLDTKVTVNFDYANITDKFDFSTYGDTTGQGNLLGYLFAVPINNKIYAESSVDTSGNPTKYVTKIGVYSHQTYTQNYIILGLYEYDPNYPQTDAGGTVTGYGRTVPFCDTGARQLSQGLNEFTVTHLNDLGETTPELKSSCLYYATIYISKNPGNGVNLAGCPGYATTFNTNPQITLDQNNVNINLTDTNPVPGKTRDQVSFNDMGWGSWAGQQNYHELPSAPRFFMQISNKVRPTI